MKQILCSISTRGRYDTTLSLAIQAVTNQTKKIDKLVIFDDNDEPKDLRDIQMYRYLLHTMDVKGIEWEVLFGQKKGQHYNHQIANTMGYEWVWRVDDDCVPDFYTLENLWKHVGPDVGGVGGAVLTPPFASVAGATGKIENLDFEPNIQWDFIKQKQEVDHLHCSFLYRAGVADYNLALSRVAHREETLFTYQLKQKGYKLFVVPDAVTWHYKNQFGGIRTETKEMFDHDEYVYRKNLEMIGKTIVVLDSGLGDHLVFKKVLPDINNPEIFSCWPDIVPGRSIQEAKNLLGDIDKYNIYIQMDKWKWTDSLETAFRKLYVDKL